MKADRQISVLCFDLFGTLTDWFGSIVAEGEALSSRTGINVDWPEFVRRWRLEGYMQMLPKIASGEVPFVPSTELHRRKLETLLQETGIHGLDETEIASFNRAWNRIHTWPDVLDGLQRLKRNYVIMPFSNGDLGCLVEISRRAALPWDAIIAADFFRKVKPDPAAYRAAIQLLRRRPDELLMVACHARDLEGARNAGMRTAYIARPFEYGDGRPKETWGTPFDYEVDSLISLADALQEGHHA